MKVLSQRKRAGPKGAAYAANYQARNNLKK